MPSLPPWPLRSIAVDFLLHRYDAILFPAIYSSDRSLFSARPPSQSDVGHSYADPQSGSMLDHSIDAG
ncbi:hypothetical protein BURMUCF2_0137 [Burkholderia multivorans CF2]|nr:hypothetical protein BURMUCF2_0137 [Burkholderia multivorans CF2]